MLDAWSGEFVNDGFRAAGKTKSDYFTVYIESGVDSDILSERLSVPASLTSIIRRPISLAGHDNLAGKLDLLFMVVSEIMDIRLKRFSCDIKVCRDEKSLSAIAKQLFGKDIKTAGFYVSAINTIYIDAKNINIHILGHELSHAVQVQYFVVPPPVTIQEVLAGYVEYQLRKYSDSLPQAGR